MDYKLRIVIEKVDLKTNKVISKNKVEDFEIEKPTSILDLGLRHKAQIQLLRKIQQHVLDAQSLLISPESETCPKCGTRLTKNGYKQSNFHAVFSDHKLKMQRHVCPNCRENYVPSIKSLFGTSIHPDLYKLQCELGSAFSFFKSECQLANLCQEKREINNHERVKKTVNAVGKALFDIMTKNEVSPQSAQSLIVQVDGGHIKDKAHDKRSFEALSAKIYRPESVIRKGNRSIIKDRTCVASAKNDRLKSIKQLIKSAATRQGMSKKTKVTVIADGAKNCWQASSILHNQCGEIEYILDWFHIAKLFQPLINSLEGENRDKIESIKWTLWQGKKTEAIIKLKEIISQFFEDNIISKLKIILTYLNQNIDQLCHYAERKEKGLLFTSHVAESTVEHLINERHKRKQKMQWTRESAHHVLQIRASIASYDWSTVWGTAVQAAIKNAA